MDTGRDVGVSPLDVGAFCFQSALVGHRAYDGRTVGYIALGDWLRDVDTGRDVGVSPLDVGVIWFRALCLGRAYDGRTVGYIALGDGLRVVDTE